MEGRGWKREMKGGRWVVVWGHHCQGLLVPALVDVVRVVVVVRSWAVVVVCASSWALVVVWGARRCPCLDGCGHLCVSVGARCRGHSTELGVVGRLLLSMRGALCVVRAPACALVMGCGGALVVVRVWAAVVIRASPWALVV